MTQLLLACRIPFIILCPSASHCPVSHTVLIPCTHAMPLCVQCSTLGMLSLSSLHSFLLPIFQVLVHTFFSSLWPFLNTYLLSLSSECPQSLSIPISYCIFFIACVTIGNNHVYLCSSCLCVCPFSLTGRHPESRALSYLLLYL